MLSIYMQLLTAIFVSAAASLLGVFAILKRMSLVGDALSHVALPGIALALVFHANPTLGALLFLFAAVIGIWLLEFKSALSVDTIVGIFFTASLALGSLLISDLELLEALLGDINSLTEADVWLSVILSSAIIAALWIIHKKLALHMVSPEMAHSIGIQSKKIELAYLFLFALGVALGIKFVGALLMGALIIIPAAAAKNIARSLTGFMALSIAAGIFSAVLGVYFSNLYQLSPGPIFILSGTAIFVLSLFWRSLFKSY